MAGSGWTGRVVRGREKKRRFRAEMRGLGESLNGRQMEETELPLLMGRRSWVMELSKDRNLGDGQAAGPLHGVVPRGWDRAGVSPSLLHVQTLSGPEAEALQAPEPWRPGIRKRPPNFG